MALPALVTIPSVRTPGKSSRRISRRLPARSVCWTDSPVMLAPGRASDATSPVPTGSPQRTRLELGRELLETSFAPLGPAVLYRNSLAVNPAQFTQTLFERCGPLPPGRCRHRAEETYGCQFSELCVGSEQREFTKAIVGSLVVLPPRWIVGAMDRYTQAHFC